jgi:hypothetical protein
MVSTPPGSPGGFFILDDRLWPNICIGKGVVAWTTILFRYIWIFIGRMRFSLAGGVRHIHAFPLDIPQRLPLETPPSATKTGGVLITAGELDF